MVSLSSQDSSVVNQKKLAEEPSKSRSSTPTSEESNSLAIIQWPGPQTEDLLQDVARQRQLTCSTPPSGQGLTVVSLLISLSLQSALKAQRCRLNGLNGPGDLQVRGLPPLPPSGTPRTLSPATSGEVAEGLRKPLQKQHPHSRSTPGNLSTADQRARHVPAHSNSCEALNGSAASAADDGGNATPDSAVSEAEQADATAAADEASTFAPDCIRMGVSTSIGQRSKMEDFAFAMSLTRPDMPGCWFRHGACFGVFDGHGGAEVAQSLAEHVPDRIQSDVHRIASSGATRMGEILTFHEKRLREEPGIWSPAVARFGGGRRARTANMLRPGSAGRSLASSGPLLLGTASEQFAGDQFGSQRPMGMRHRQHSSVVELASLARAESADSALVAAAAAARSAGGSPVLLPPRPSLRGPVEVLHIEEALSITSTASLPAPPVPHSPRPPATFEMPPLTSVASAPQPLLSPERTGSRLNRVLSGDQSNISAHISHASSTVTNGSNGNSSTRTGGTATCQFRSFTVDATRPLPTSVSNHPPDPLYSNGGAATTAAGVATGPGSPPPPIRSQSDVGLCDAPATTESAAKPAAAPPPQPTGSFGGGMIGSDGGTTLQPPEVCASPSVRPLGPRPPRPPAAPSAGSGGSHGSWPRTSGHAAYPASSPASVSSFAAAAIGSAGAGVSNAHIPHSPSPSPLAAPPIPVPTHTVDYATDTTDTEPADAIGDAAAAAYSDDGDVDVEDPPFDHDHHAPDPGSTALVATVIDNRMFVANVGDCRLILAVLDPVTGQAVPHTVTSDHVPHAHPGEAARLKARGVPVSADGYVGPDGGVLQVSRSIGDFYTKIALGEEVIISEPELYTVELGPQHLFAVAASDGITCAMKDDTIVNQVCRYLNERSPSGQYNDPNHAAEQLVRYAIDSMNSSDNASAIITCFKYEKPPMPKRPVRIWGGGGGGGAGRGPTARRESAPIVPGAFSSASAPAITLTQ